MGVDEALDVGWCGRLEVELEGFVSAVEHSYGFGIISFLFTEQFC